MVISSFSSHFTKEHTMSQKKTILENINNFRLSAVFFSHKQSKLFKLDNINILLVSP